MGQNKSTNFLTPLASGRTLTRTTDPLVFQTNVTPASLPENGARGNEHPETGAGGSSPAPGVFARIIDHADVILVGLAIVAVAYLLGVLVWAAGGQQ